MIYLISQARADYISFEKSADGFQIVGPSQVATIYVDSQDHPGVIRAAADLAEDLKRVTGKLAQLEKQIDTVKGLPIIIGSIGQSRIIDGLSKAGKIDLTAIEGKWEAGITQVVDSPYPGIDRALVIAGSDKRGTIFGVYQLSRQIGVSPWHWWADVPIEQHETVTVTAGTYVIDSPKVKYRGIFINDEEPAFGPWAREKFGGINSKMYSHMFELILRLKGNYLWPAMWGKSFYENDPENARLADEYGIVVGTSHHEPMMRAHVDWDRHKNKMGNGQWNYAANEVGLKKFWEEGIERNKKYETTITLGMRGDGDEPMIEGGDIAANAKLLEKVVADQRSIIADKINSELSKVPQIWALYKEVADYYAHGMRVPDDVTLLWCDDNWGNIRRLPTADERKRSGGAGIYYHFDYVGSPRSYKWMNCNPLPKIWEQMNLAYHYGADRVWVVNVGDLKPMELPIDFFLTMAWNPESINHESIGQFTQQWAMEQFGSQHAEQIAELLSKYAKYNAWRKPELLEPTTFSLVNYQEAEQVLSAWQELVQQAEQIQIKLAREYKDAYYQLVLYPVKASANHTAFYIATGRNRLYAKQGRISANQEADRVRELFELDKSLASAYHKLNNGKWNHMMAQTHFGYRSWNDPRTNIMPELSAVNVEDKAELGIAIEGSESAWPGANEQAKLPDFDSQSKQRHWIDLFRRGKKSVDYSITTSHSWIRIDKSKGTITNDARLWVSIDWENIPVGVQHGDIQIQQSGGQTVAVKITAGVTTTPSAFYADAASANIESAPARWVKIPDYGRGRSGMTILPVNAPSATPGKDSPRLEYKVVIPESGAIQVDLQTNPALNFLPDRGVRIAVSFDDQNPQILDAFAGQNFQDPNKRPDLSSPAIRDWGNWVRDNIRTLKSTHTLDSAGTHTLKIWMVDPGIVLEKITIHRGKLPKSYFGPPVIDRN